MRFMFHEPGKALAMGALTANAVDVEAAAFWARRGFLRSKDDLLILFRSIADIGAPKGRRRALAKSRIKQAQISLSTI